MSKLYNPEPMFHFTPENSKLITELDRRVHEDMANEDKKKETGLYIKVGRKYVVTAADSRNYVLNLIKTNPKTGEQKLAPLAWYGNLQQCFTDLVERKAITEHSARSVKEFGEALQQVKQEVMDAVNKQLLEDWYKWTNNPSTNPLKNSGDWLTYPQLNTSIMQSVI